MRSKYILAMFAGALALATTSCKNDTDAVESQATSFEASLADQAECLKTTLVAKGGKYVGSWTSGDAIVITDGNVASKYVTASTGDVKAKFALAAGETAVSDVDSTFCLAYYPASGFKGIAGDSALNVTIPEVQYYNPNGTVDEGAFPMISKTNSRSLPFYNLASVIRIKVKSDFKQAVRSIKVVSTDKPLSGDAVACFSNGEPTLLMSPDASKTVTLDCQNTEIDENGSMFFIVIPPAIYPAKTLSYTVVTGAGMKSTFQADFDVKRSTFYGEDKAMTVYIGDGSSSEPGVVIE